MTLSALLLPLLLVDDLSLSALSVVVEATFARLFAGGLIVSSVGGFLEETALSCLPSVRAGGAAFFLGCSLFVSFGATGSQAEEVDELSSSSSLSSRTRRFPVLLPRFLEAALVLAVEELLLLLLA